MYNSDSVTHVCDWLHMCAISYICVSTHIHTHYLFHILFHYRLLQDIEYSSLCYTQILIVYFIYSSVYLGEGNGTPLQYSCLENPWTEEPGRLQSMGSLKVGHDWVISLSLFSFIHWRRKWQPTPVFLPGESQGRQSLVGCCLWGPTESDTTEAT